MRLTSRPDALTPIMRAAMRCAPLFAALAAAGLAGCAGSPAAQMRENIAYEEARNLVPAHYKDDLPAFFRTYLNDPTGIRDGAISRPALVKVDLIERYVACVRYNAKKNGGQYAGTQTGAAVYISGKFDRLIDLGREEGGPTAGGQSESRKALRDFCAAAVYEPLPELSKITR